MWSKKIKYASINEQSETGRAKTHDIGREALSCGILKGMLITFRHIFQKKATISYPEQKRPFSPVFRGLQILNRDEEGRERCTACGLCAVACPAEAITMEAAERKPGEENLYREEKYAAKYEINMLRCIFCGLCEEACPKDAVYLSETFAPSNYQRKGFIYGKGGSVDSASERQTRKNIRKQWVTGQRNDDTAELTESTN